MGRQAQTLVVKPQYYQNIIDGLPIDTTVTTSNYLYEGDMCELTNSLGVAPIAGGAMSATIVAALGRFLGVSGSTSPTQYWNNKAPDSVQVYTAGVAKFYETAAETYKVGDEVTIGADAQTITNCSNFKGPDCSPAGLFTAGTVTGGTLSAGNHTVSATYITAIGETTPGTSVAVTATSGQGLIYDFDNAAAFTIPSWAIGVAIYIDGLFAEAIIGTGSAVALAADLNITGVNVSNPRTVPTSNCLAIGRIVPEEEPPINQNYVSGVTGVSGRFVHVRFKNIYPFDRVRVA